MSIPPRSVKGGGPCSVLDGIWKFTEITGTGSCQGRADLRQKVFYFPRVFPGSKWRDPGNAPEVYGYRGVPGIH